MTDSPYEPHDDRPTGGSGLRPGTLLGGYELKEPIGQGGMGFVWKAWDTTGERHVALKLLPEVVRGNAETLAQVKAAFQVVHALTHQHIGKTIGLFQAPVFGPYVVMDYLPGITLAKFARIYREQHGRLSPKLVARLLTPVAQALDYAHGKRVLHRDVKPLNILVEVREGKAEDVWLIDFGLAAEIRNVSSRGANQRTDSSGTLEYQSPEQLKGKRSLWNGQSDQYSLAVVAYELLAGHLPFEGTDLVLMQAIVHEEPDPIATQPESVNTALLKALSKQKEERFATCQEFVSALVATAPAPPLVAVQQPAKPPEQASSARPSSPQSFSGTRAGDLKTVHMGDVELTLVWCPPGTFLMGTPGATNDESQVEVTLTQGFWLGQTAVTQKQYEAVMQTNPSHFKGAKRPVEKVTWDDAVKCCVQLTARLDREGSLPLGWAVQLPTEAQWEYACRAGATTAYSFGDAESQLSRFAWFGGSGGTHEVGGKRENQWGFYDMHGNVWEWCSDRYVSKLEGGSDPAGPSSGWYRLGRGGCWSDSSGDCRSAYRGRRVPSFRSSGLGFRVALVPSSE